MIDDETIRRAATPADRGAVSVVLARAFQDDPVYRFAIPDPDPDRRARALPHLMHTLVAVLHRGMGPTEVVEVGGHVVGVAAWNDPGAVAPGALRTALAVPGLLRGVGTRLPAFGELGDALESVRPVTPHRYLFHLGTDPGWWGRGVGSALLRPVLADASELVHLETKPGNIGYCRRHGFEVTGEVPFAAVELVTMAREAR